MPKQLIANIIMTPKGEILRSYHRHDCVLYVEDGVTYMCDGGIDYQRRGGRPYTDLSVYSDDPFEDVRLFLVWGTRGKSGDEPFKYVALCDMTRDHIQAVLETQRIDDWRRELMEQELEWRDE